MEECSKKLGCSAELIKSLEDEVKEKEQSLSFVMDIIGEMAMVFERKAVDPS